MDNSALLAAALFILAGIPARAARLEDTVATVNGEAILLSDFQREYATKVRELRQDDPQALAKPGAVQRLKRATLDELVERSLLSQTADQEGVHVLDREVDDAVSRIESGFTEGDDGRTLTEQGAQDAFQAELKAEGVSYGQFRDRMKKELAGRKLIQQEVGLTIHPPSEGKVRAYFNEIAAFLASSSTQTPAGLSGEDLDRFIQIAGQIHHLTAERVRVSDILVAVSPDASDNEIARARAKAEAIRTDILARGTSSFADIAKAESEDAETASQGGDLGLVARGESAPGFDKAIFSLALGQVSEPILTGGGWRIVLLRDHSIAEAPRFEQFKDQLSKIMEQADYRRQAERYVQDLKDKAEITERPEAL